MTRGLVRGSMAEKLGAADAGDAEHECKICYNDFDEQRRAPKLLGCSHTFCRECLETVHLSKGRGWRIGCPVCRRRTVVPNYRIDCLPDNRAVIAALPPPPSPPLRAAVEEEEIRTEVADSRESRDSSSFCSCKKAALATGCVCAVLSFVATAVTLFLGLVLLHFREISMVFLFVAGVLALFSLILTWLLCTVC